MDEDVKAGPGSHSHPNAASDGAPAEGHRGTAEHRAAAEHSDGPALLPAAPPQPLLPPPGEWKPGDQAGRRPTGPPRKKSSAGFWLLIFLAALLLIGGIYWWARKHETPSKTPSSSNAGKGGKGGGAAGGAVNVVATRATRGNIGVYFTGLGAVTPIYTVTVKTRVDGELMSVKYTEGDMVKKDDLLALIDPRPYDAALAQAEGTLARDQALLANAKIDLARYQLLIKTNAVPEQTLATQQATVDQDAGTVKLDEGMVEAAKVNVAYTKITAPLTGRVGLRLVDPGNIVQATDTNGLVVITQVDPISVIFTISEDQLPTVAQKMRAGQKLEVDAYDRDQTKKLAQGTLVTIDNEIDQTTGTVRLRATFDNQSGALFPNQFVNARLLVQEKRGVVLIPNAAIQRTSSTTFVYLVQPNSIVLVRNITLGTGEADNTEVTSGLNPGDVVVMTGADKLEQGSKVNAQIQGESGSQPAQGASKSGSGSKQTNSKSTGKKK